VDRAYESASIVAEGLAYLKVKHVLVFPTTWLLFFYLGKWFFDNVLGRYHATSSRYWAVACKMLFLLTFVAACNLLQVCMCMCACGVCELSIYALCLALIVPPPSSSRCS